MRVAPRRTAEAGPVLALFAALFGLSPAPLAADGAMEGFARAAESAPAMQGHDAEAAMRDPEAEARRRRLFFDPAGTEEGEGRVSCDHRASRRPDVVAGPAVVAIVSDAVTARVRLRVWRAGDDAAAVTRDLAARAGAGERVEALAFLACR